LFSSTLLLLLCANGKTVSLPLIVTDTAVLDASVPLSSVLLYHNSTYLLEVRLKIILMFSFYVLLDLIFFDKGTASMLTLR
jgi:hypothetical protein